MSGVSAPVLDQIFQLVAIVAWKIVAERPGRDDLVGDLTAVKITHLFHRGVHLGRSDPRSFAER